MESDTMSRLELASERLKTALDSLERGLGGRPAGDADTANLQGRVAELEAERERLLEKLAALEEDMAALSGANEEVENRLDGAIGEIRAALAR
jgi:chromosome segregation ATPase